jgi:hypothetical protein
VLFDGKPQPAKTKRANTHGNEPKCHRCILP